VKLTTHLHLVPRSKNAWSYTSTPPIRLHEINMGAKPNDDIVSHDSAESDNGIKTHADTEIDTKNIAKI
jgi:hypothetical protein